MLINISSDQIIISYVGEQIVVPRGGLEIALPKAIYELYAAQKMSEDIYVINGPGSFTNLRIGCLVLNMLKDFIPNLKLYTAAKHNLYRNLYEGGYIPVQGLIYIGQQKNYWRCDLKHQIYEKRLLDGSGADNVFEDGYRLDEVSAMQSDYIVSFRENNGIEVNYGDKIYNLNPQDMGFELVDQLVPNYILEANISQPKNS